MKKIKFLLLTALALILIPFSASAETTVADAVIHVNNNLPVFFVNGREDVDFKQYFTIRDARQDVIVEDDYMDLGGFDINVSGKYTIKIEYTGSNGRSVNRSLNVEVIDEDVEAPFVSGALDEYKVNVNTTIEDFYRRFNARDNVDGLIVFTNNDFIEGIDAVDVSIIDSQYEVTVRIVDSSGNAFERPGIIRIVDELEPYIFGVKNITTRLGKEVDYKSHLVFQDNYDEVDKLVIKYTYLFNDEETNGIDFNKIGEHTVRVSATDTSGNISTVEQYRVIVENGLSLPALVLIINGIILVLGAVVLFVAITVRKRSKE